MDVGLFYEASIGVLSVKAVYSMTICDGELFEMGVVEQGGLIFFQ